ncbi:MAG: ECF transporter S component [Clostridia bacterium]|nr:ECF transporter S component [Clostridia bacterium]
MKTYNKNLKMVLAGLFMALGYVLPFLTGQIPEIGSMLCPMHIPVLICGFICGWQWGLAVGFATPLLRSLTLGAPVLFPMAVSMAFELAAYGAFAGLMRKLLPKKRPYIYVSLLTSMILGRIVFGISMLICMGIKGGSYTLAAFIAGAVTNAIPGIVVQIIIVPVAVFLIEKALLQKETKSISNSGYADLSQLFAKIDARLKNGKVILAIDGRSGSGKTTLSQLLKAVYKCNVIHMDDFFLRPEQRTKERYNEAGGNVDRERFLSEVLIPLSRGESFTYRPFDCAKMDFGDPVSVIPTELTVIEGAYSTHPDLFSYYNIKVFLDVTKEEQEARIFKRGEEKSKAFFEKWIPLEEKYIKELSVMERCDIRLNGIDK